jgi:hypothetical protein
MCKYDSIFTEINVLNKFTDTATVWSGTYKIKEEGKL